MDNNNIPLEIIQLKKDIKNKALHISHIEIENRRRSIPDKVILLNNKYKRKSENYIKLCRFALKIIG